MSILINRNTRVICQGFTGRQGTFHSEQASPTARSSSAASLRAAAARLHLGLPVFDTVREAVSATGATASMIYVPAAFAADAILEAADAGIELVVCITEGVPVNDMVRVKAALAAVDHAARRAQLSGRHHAGGMQDRHHARLHSQEGRRRASCRARER